MEVLKMSKTEVIHNTAPTVPEIHTGSQNLMRSCNYQFFTVANRSIATSVIVIKNVFEVIHMICTIYRDSGTCLQPRATRKLAYLRITLRNAGRDFDASFGHKWPEPVTLRTDGSPATIKS
jgi:hypothetical protein